MTTSVAIRVENDGSVDRVLPFMHSVVALPPPDAVPIGPNSYSNIMEICLSAVAVSDTYELFRGSTSIHIQGVRQ